MSLIDILDDGTLNIVIGQFSNTDFELVISCVCKDFYDILKNMRKSHRFKISTNWIASSESILTWTFQNYCKIPFPKYVAYNICSCGSIQRMQILCNYTNIEVDSIMCCFAAENGHLHLIEWLYSKGCPLDKYVSISAASNGHTNLLEWLHEKKCELDKHVCNAAVGGITADRKGCWDSNIDKTTNGGHFDTLMWLIENECPIDYNDIVSAAIRNNHIGILEWVRVNKHFDFNGKNFLSNEAIQGGHIDVLKYLHKNGVNWDIDSEPLYCAATYGYVDIMEYAFQNGCKLPEKEAFSLCDIGAHNCNLNVIKWARKHGCHWNEKTFSYAAMYNDIEMVKWFYENGCPWDEETSYVAAMFGNFDVLKWVSDRGCPWSKDLCIAATDSGHLDIIIWACENGCIVDEKTIDAAMRTNNTKIIQWFQYWFKRC